MGEYASFYIMRNGQMFFQSVIGISYSQRAMDVRPSFSTLLLTLGIISVLDFHYSTRQL